jgi:hypothetical protein
MTLPLQDPTALFREIYKPVEIKWYQNPWIFLYFAIGLCIVFAFFIIFFKFRRKQANQPLILLLAKLEKLETRIIKGEQDIASGYVQLSEIAREGGYNASLLMRGTTDLEYQQILMKEHPEIIQILDSCINHLIKIKFAQISLSQDYLLVDIERMRNILRKIM